MNTIEQVARALARRHHDSERDGIFPNASSLDWMVEQTWSLHKDEARAAIEAMRIVPENVLAAGRNCKENGTGEMWSAMIDEILK